MAAPYGDGLFLNEPPKGNGLEIEDIFHLVVPKPEDPVNDSRIDSKYPNVAIITPDSINNRFGGMWALEQLDLSMPFYTEMYLHLGHQYNKSGTVADGMTFTMHNDPDGINAIGGAGEGLGVYRGRKWTGGYWNGYPVTARHGTFLKNSLVIEFDTYRNTTKDGAFVDDPLGSFPAHCALLIPRSTTIYTRDHKNQYFFTPSQNWIRFEVGWTPDDNGGGTINYSFDGNQMSYSVNSIMSTFGGTKVWWGFTGASGYYTSVQAVALTRLPEQGITAEKSVKNAAGVYIDKGTAFPGDILTYTIRVTSKTTTGPVGPVVINDRVSEYVEDAAGMVRVTTNDGDEFSVTPTYADTVMTVFTDRSLAKKGDWIEITFNVRVREDAARSIVENYAVIEAGLPETQNTNTTEVTILAGGDPVKEVSGDSAAGQGGSKVSAGDEITYEITYTNFDVEEADITITDELPDGVDHVLGGNYYADTHTVIWTKPDVPGGESGKVSLVVRVNDSAVVKVENSATVKVGNNEARITNIVRNPVTPEDPVKSVPDTSAAGYGGSAVGLGDEITYDISYSNYAETAATIAITDRLPAGVDFVSATAGSVYDDLNYVVTWTLPDVPSGESGKVSLVVRVNESAVVKIENEAAVQVGENSPLTTNIVENPVTPQNPKKKVSDDSEAGQGGSTVKAGDSMTYEITYLNYKDTAAAIVITDRLPDEVDFVSAMNGGIYDDAVHTVTWTLSGVPSGVGGTVSVMVVINERAVSNIENYAMVQVSENNPLTTNIVKNPVSSEDPEKRVSEMSEAGKDGSTVKAGDEITYDIIYRNYSETTATIVITDRLPAGVDFVSASNDGTHNDKTHTVTWIIQNVPSGDTGIVSVLVRVNKKAVVRIGNYAIVKVGANDPRFTNLVVNPIAGYCLGTLQSTKCRKTVKGHLIWEDNGNSDTRPPAVEIILIRDGVVYKSISMDSAGDGAFVFGCLPVWKNSDHKYNYQAEETIIPDGYTKTIEGYNIINALAP